MKRYVSVSIALSVAMGGLVAQNENPFVKSTDLKRLDADAKAFIDAGSDLVQKAAESTVSIFVGQYHRVGYGVAVDETIIAAKWSELPRTHLPMSAVGKDNKTRRLKLLGGFEEHDLAFLKYEGEALPVLDFSSTESLKTGELLFVPNSVGQVMDAGVVSVLTRSVRSLDKGFLGVKARDTENREGVLVTSVNPGSGAMKAGLEAGDVIRSINNNEITSLQEFSNRLKSFQPGDEIEILFTRQGEKITGLAALGSVPEEVGVQHNRRVEVMKRMGVGRLSRRNEGYPNVIQTDLDLRAKDCGAPVVNLDGKVIGLSIARASRIKTYVLPSEVIHEALKTFREQP